MKIRHFIIAFVLVLTAFHNTQCRSQGVNTLFVDSMPFFPEAPQDTAYEGQTYTFLMQVHNNTNIFINNSVSFNMRVDSATITFLANVQTTIPPNDSVSLTVTPFNFQQPLFKAGNNIVVVWPVVNGLSVPIDSFITTVFFVPLNSLGDDEVMGQQLQLYPNPVHDYMHLDTSEGMVEYVRIYATTGQLIRDISFQRSRSIDVSFLRKGTYIIELNLNGKWVRKKFVKK
ncbi:MAG: T9SS type A sorting domain-containing protein [Bacteroidota bacterium]|nr:T9SS type A sorting domain-containing protein [Bacteroidota bacterium]